MRKTFIALLTVAVLFPSVSFAQTADSQTLQIIALLQEQIRLLQEIIRILTARLSVSPPVPTETLSPAFAPVPVVPSVRLLANGSGGQVSVKKEESIKLSWELSNHGWSYCGKLFGWEGTLKPMPGSEDVGSISYDTRYDIFCYINGTKYADSVTVLVAQPGPAPVATTSPPASTYSIAPGSGFNNCSLEVSRSFVTLGKDAIEATWTIDSDPRNAYFYWRGKDNGVDIGKVYGGKTQRIRTFEYGAYPWKYERYVEIFFSQNHFIGDPYTPGCTTNTITFEVKQ